MISACNHRLLLIEQALSNNGSILAQLQLLELNSKPGVDASCQSDCEEGDERELDALRDWIVRLRAQVARTERRIERLRSSVERHDAQLSDIKSRIIWSSGGCAVVRPHNRWDVHVHTDGSAAQREMAANRSTQVNSKWPLSLQIAHQKLSITHATASGSSRPWSARNVVGCSGIKPQLSQSFTSLLSANHRQQSSVRVATGETSSHDNRSFEMRPRDNLHHSTNELNTFR